MAGWEFFRVDLIGDAPGSFPVVVEAILLDASHLLLSCAIPTHIYNRQKEKEGRNCSNQSEYGYLSLHSLREVIPPPSHPSRVSCIPTVFRLPYEPFQEILSNIFPWPTAYCQIVYTTWYRPEAEMFLERARTLLALSVTCRAMRQMVLTEAWKGYFMRRMRLKNNHKIWTKLRSECGVLLRNPHLAAYVRYSSPSVHLEYLDTSSDRA